MRRQAGGAAAIRAAIVGACVAAVAGGAPAASALTVRATYQWRPCSSASDRLGVPKPVIAGTLVVRRRGSARSVRVSLLGNGTAPARVSLPGSGRIIGTLELQTPAVRITNAAGAVERVPLHVRQLPNGRVTFSVRNADDHGHVNTLVALQRAARIAAAASPRRLRR